jgi:PAS domain S-box-containing protein
MDFFRNLRIRSKLLVSYSAVFMLVITLGGLNMYSHLRESVEANIEAELTNSTAAILNLVRTSVSVSIKNHLRAAAEKNLEMVQYFYGLYQSGRLTEAEAKAQAEALLLSQRVGTTGYIACVNSRGVMVLHPEPLWIGQDITPHAFVQQMIALKEGYLEYDWRNPGEAYARPKALYMTYFAPWDWIINVSSYRREFRELVNVSDFREGVLSMRFGLTGYSFVTDGVGNIIIHPKLEGINIFRDPEIPQEPLRTMLERKNGKLEYIWRNPDEPHPRKKVVIFNYLPEYDWLVACSSYQDEFYSPLGNISRIILFTLLASLLLLLPLSFFVSGTITNPLRDLIERLERAAEGDFSIRVRRRSRDEVGRLAAYFNSFMDRLETYSRSLESEIAERREAEEALRVSEEKYRSVMEAAPDPIIVYDMEGRVTYFNPAFQAVFGWTLAECLGRRMDHFVPPETWPETRRGLAIIAAGRQLPSVETRRRTKSGRIVDVSVRGAVYRDRDGRPAGSVIIHRDITDVKRLEKELIDIGDRERQKIGRDLHDDLCPHLIGIEGLGKVLKSRLAARPAGEAGLASQITDLIKEAIGKTRHLAQGLSPVHLEDHGLPTALRGLALKTGAIFGVACEYEGLAELELGDPTTATHLFYIAQEAVNNAVRHGRPGAIRIRLTQAAGRLELEVVDDGRGLPEEPRGDGMGLRLMAFRARMIGAVLDIKGSEGDGTRVALTLEGGAD